ncbi:MAG: glycosyltransferase family 2 protein [Thermovenabulum sp.]|uniref:glycosyltransferase family 2 protein n=1 Tax=Thermovenabulum sp. TaxID=3100335 RepID=UPI003C79C238
METLRRFIIGFNDFVLFYVITINFIYFLQLILSAIHLGNYIKRTIYSDYKRYIASQNMLPISIIVPAYNEEKTIVENIKSLMDLNYPLFEIVVVNDGSKDSTLKNIIEAFNLKKINQPIRVKLRTEKIKGIYKNPEILNLTVVDKENGGKADALNAGINVSSYPVFVSIDADSVLESDSLVRVIMPFLEDMNTVAVGGIVRVANGSIIEGGIIKEVRLPQKSLACFQVVEYLRAFLTGRMGWDALGSLLIISGAFGAFKKEAVIEAGGYQRGTIGEDMELVVRLHRKMRENKKKYRIRFIPDPVCWTQVPEDLKSLKIQRRRWQIGLMDSLFRHRKILLNPKFGVLGLYAATYFWIFEMLGPLIEVAGYIIVPISFLFGIIDYRFFLLFLAISICYGIILSAGAILLEEYTFNKYKSLGQFLKLMFYAILENFGYRQLTAFFRVSGIMNYNRLKHSWGVVGRKEF